MVDAFREQAESDDNTPVRGKTIRRRRQVGLRTLLLLTAAIAVWIAVFVNRRENALLEQRIKAMVPLAHELTIKTDEKIAAVALEQLWHYERRWDVFLPHHDYWVCLATRGVGIGLPIDCKSVLIKPGRHRIVLEQRATQDGWRVTLTLDDALVLTVDEPKSWFDETGLSFLSSSGVASPTEEFAPAAQVVLFVSLFPHSYRVAGATVPSPPDEGIALWIQPNAIPSAGSQAARAPR